MSELWRRLLWLFRRGPLDRELEEEMQFHLDARRQFGNPLLLRQRCREMWREGQPPRGLYNRAREFGISHASRAVVSAFEILRGTKTFKIPYMHAGWRTVWLPGTWM